MLKLSLVPLLCGHLRNIICESFVDAEEFLIVRTLAGREEIENRPSIFKTVRQKMGRHFEELM
jgi:predicted Fe-Mo cluster-binding NifX family protein